MPLGAGGGDFFKPVSGRYALKLINVKDASRATTYPSDTPGGAPRSVTNVVWQFEIYNVDGSPVRDPAHPEIPVAVVDGITGPSVGYSSAGKPARGRVWLTRVLAGKGIAFPKDTPSPEQTGLYVQQAMQTWVWGTFGLSDDAEPKVILKELEPMSPQPGGAPVAQAVAPAAPLAAPVMAAAPATFAPTAAPAAPVFTAALAEAPAAPVFAAPAAPAVAEAPAAPVFGAAPAAPVFPAPAAAAPVAAPVDAIPPMVFPTA